MTIIATVITCPQRWEHYQRLRANFDAIGFPFPLRTFQTAQNLANPYANNNLNAYAALSYCERHLPDAPDSWILYLEDDVVLHTEILDLLPWMVNYGIAEEVDCWFLCNRKNRSRRDLRANGVAIKELDFPPLGAHGLLIPKRHLRCILDAHWADVSDQAMFAAMNHPRLRILQIVKPALVEHIGECSTYYPDEKRTLEINHAN